ncbi:type IV secretion protein DotO [Gluconacetobacter diazotrophicus]|uniref:Type IV secretion protein DotO n=1 Tax=Gluconacetobacter diazotrophicus TaxID=33996 RepID=A0A7W4FF71_GLUDI|nr:type IV secretion protein DotO [Gluconacetobacter diazotrophicus]MBB2156628.1 type IV secretion protein DotO [Gluconacetobacter diazotrophicus]
MKKNARASEVKTGAATRIRFSPLDWMLRLVGGLSRAYGRSITSFCDLATCDQYGLISFRGDYATVIEISGLRRLAGDAEIESSSRRIRRALGGLFETPGHAMQFYYVADPEGVRRTIAQNLEHRRTLARALNAEFEDVFRERMRVLPPYMRVERILLVVWTRRGRITRQELQQAGKRRTALTDGFPALGDAQNPFLGSTELGTVHQTVVQSVVSAFANENVGAVALEPRDGLKAIREELYRETIGSQWSPRTPLDRPPERMPDADVPQDISDLLWPPLREQLFMGDGVTPDYFNTARIGIYDWTPVELTLPPEAGEGDVCSFTTLAASMAANRMPWRSSTLIEGVNGGYMMWKDIVATTLKFGGNTAIHAAFEQLKHLRKSKQDTVVKVRTTYATYAPAGDAGTLRVRQARLQMGISGWGKAQANRVCGDPLAGVLSSAPGLAIASTAPPAAGPLSQILAMQAWARAGGPWREGSVLLRTADGTIVPFDPAGVGREVTLDIFVAPSRCGKSMLANVLLLGTVFSSACLTGDGARLPLIGKLDVGDSSSGFVDMLHSGLRPEDRHLAIHVPFSLTEEHAYNIFDTEACCRYPLEAHRAFLTNFLGLATRSLDSRDFEGMNQLIGSLITAAYELVSDDTTNSRPKKYRPGISETIDTALARHRIQVDTNSNWYSVADAFAAAGDMRMATMATQRAVPVLTDLFEVVRLPRVMNGFEETPANGSESVIQVFNRYLTDFIDKYPTLDMPTQLDLGEARVIVLDIDRVAPEGMGDAQRQTELMYLLGFQIISRNLFLRPADAQAVPEHVRPYHLRRFTEFRESFKRLECDEFQRASAAPLVQRQFEGAARRAAKVNIRLGITSQKVEDFGNYLAEQATGRFILGAGDGKEAAAIADKFKLTDAGRTIVTEGLNGPRPDGSGAPFILQILVGGAWYEMYLLNLVGPIELWALSTNPHDAALRRRLYEALGSTEARRRLASVFPLGTAVKEIDRRKDARIRLGEAAGVAFGGVIDEIAHELSAGTGLGARIRTSEDDTALTTVSPIMAS